MAEIGKKRNYEQMTAAECYAEICSRKIEATDEYYSTEEILRWKGARMSILFDTFVLV